MPLVPSNHAFIADTARVIGDVELGPEANVWYGVVIRGDVGKITIGAGTNVQDNTVIHSDFGRPNTIGANTSIGHGAMVHGLQIGDETLIGMGAVILAESTIGNNCLIAAGAVVPPGMNVPDGMVVMGVPGKIVRPINEAELQHIRDTAEKYIALARQHGDHTNDSAADQRQSK